MELLKFNNTFAKLGEKFFTKVSPKGLSDPCVVDINMAVLNMLGISSEKIDTKAEIPLWLMSLCSGNELPKGCDTIAMVYSGHQFGGYSPELGD